jgi:import receptor subunit TOM70
VSVHFIGRQHAKEAMARRTPVMPSKHFIKMYFSSFIEDPIINTWVQEKESDSAEADLRFVLKLTPSLVPFSPHQTCF